MKKFIKIVIPCLTMFLLIYLWRDGKDILNGLFVAFPIMYLLLGLISKDKKELLEASALKKCIENLEKNIALRNVEFTEDELLILKNFSFFG